MRTLFLLIFMPVLLAAALLRPFIATGSGADHNTALQAALQNVLEQAQSGSDRQREQGGANPLFISSYKVLKSAVGGDGLSRVTVRAEVSLPGSGEELEKMGLLEQKLELPRILLVGQNSTVRDALEEKCLLAVAQSLTDGGVFLIDRAEQEAFLREQKVAAFTELNNGVADYGLRLNADYVVRLDYKLSGDRTALYLDAQTVAPSLGKMVFAADEAVVLGSSANEVEQLLKIKEGGRRLGAVLLEKITANWQFMAANGAYFQLVVEGFGGYKQLLTLQKKLGKLPGVLTVSEIESSGSKATLLFKYKGTRQELKEQIFQLLAKDKLTIRLLRSENSRAIIKIVNQ